MAAPAVVAIAGVPIHAADIDAAAHHIIDAARQPRSFTVHLCNAYVLALASRDHAYARVLRIGDLNLADGAPVAWFAALAGWRLRPRPSGTELMHATIREGLPHGIRHLLYGSTPQVAAALATELRREHRNVNLAAVIAPPFGPVTSEQIDALAVTAEEVGAHVVWVGLGTPKQDLVVAGLQGRLTAACVPVGAAFDFIAGATPRAPRWMRTSGLEWVHRLIREPSRLWRRYLWGNLHFVWALATTGRILRRANPDDA